MDIFQKIPVVLNAWERKIQNGSHFADFENQTIANVIYDLVIYDLRGQKCIVILFFYSKVIITLLIEFLANLLNKYISNDPVGSNIVFVHHKTNGRPTLIYFQGF